MQYTIIDGLLSGKQGEPRAIVVPLDRVGGRFSDLADSCKAAGGAYSHKAQGQAWGFAFLTRGDAQAWADKELAACTRCECGEVSGERCPAVGEVSVAWMPVWLRGTHEAAGNSGSWPANGSELLEVSRGCLDGWLRDSEGAWLEEVQ